MDQVRLTLVKKGATIGFPICSIMKKPKDEGVIDRIDCTGTRFK